MLSDPDSLPIRICMILALIAIYGFFTAVNTALGSASRITEKIQSANRLVILLASFLGAWLALLDWKLMLGYIICLVICGQYFAHKIGLQHDEGISQKTMPFITVFSTV